MKKLLIPVFACSLFLSHCHDRTTVHASPLVQETAPANIAGKWVMSVDTPHGAVKGPFQLQQEGAKVTGTFEAEHIGTLPATGTVDGKKVSFSLAVPGGDAFTFSGTVDGSKMSGSTAMGGAWSATRE